MSTEYQAIIGMVRDEKELDWARGWCDLSGQRVRDQIESSVNRRGGRIVAYANTSLSHFDGGKRLIDIYGRPTKRNILVTLSFPDAGSLNGFENAIRQRGYEIRGSKTKQIEQTIAA